MNKNIWLIGVLGVLALGVGYAVLNNRQQQPLPADTQTFSTPTTVESFPTDSQAQEDASTGPISTSQTVTLSSGGFFFDPNRLNLKPGEVTVNVVRNTGFHTFVIDELGIKETLRSDQTFAFTAEPGTYEYYCDVPGHREQGMFGSLIVN